MKNLKSTIKLLNDCRVQNDSLINNIELDGEINAYILQSNANGNKKSIVVKFNNKQAKNAFMKEKAKLKSIDKFKNVYVNDFLARDSSEIFKHVKSLKAIYLYS